MIKCSNKHQEKIKIHFFTIKGTTLIISFFVILKNANIKIKIATNQENIKVSNKTVEKSMYQQIFL